MLDFCLSHFGCPIFEGLNRNFSLLTVSTTNLSTFRRVLVCGRVYFFKRIENLGFCL